MASARGPKELGLLEIILLCLFSFEGQNLIGLAEGMLQSQDQCLGQAAKPINPGHTSTMSVGTLCPYMYNQNAPSIISCCFPHPTIESVIFVSVEVACHAYILFCRR